jgi:hypothetical protein
MKKKVTVTIVILATILTTIGFLTLIIAITKQPVNTYRLVQLTGTTIEIPQGVLIITEGHTLSYNGKDIDYKRTYYGFILRDDGVITPYVIQAKELSEQEFWNWSKDINK